MTQFTVHYTHTAANGSQESRTHEISVEAGSDNAATLRRILSQFHSGNAGIYRFIDTLGVLITKIVSTSSRGFVAVTNLSETTPETDYRVTLNAVVNGRTRPLTPFNVKATSGAEAKLKVWNSFKVEGSRLGDRFCDEAAGLESLTVTVEVRETATVIFEAAPAVSAAERADLEGEARTFENFRVSTSSDRRRVRIVNTETGEITNQSGAEAWAIWSPMIRAANPLRYRMYDFITDNVSSGG